MTAADAVLVHYAEVGLKGGNRRSFERRLGDRLRQALASAQIAAKVSFRDRRFLVVPERPGATDAALRAVTRVPGVANAAVVRRLAPDLDAIGEAAVAALAEAQPGSFKVESRRGDKSFPQTSIEISRAAGAACAAASKRPVDVHDPDVVVRVWVMKGVAWVSAGKVPGPGGLPVGSGGRLLAFVSGGLDSVVAAWLMLRRGARVTAVHFHNRTQQGPAVLEKLEDLCGELAWAAGTMPLVVVPFEACQRAIVAAVPARHRMLVYRRAMFRIGSVLAAERHALGYVTGDSLGQVASQTAENLRTIQAVADRPVYAPLVGSDKAEIVDLARRIGTYDISIRPHADCCSFLLARHPATASTPEEVAALEAGVPWDRVVAEAAAGAVERPIAPGAPAPAR